MATVIPDPKDPRDYIYVSDPADILPESMEAADETGPIEDQKTFGTCGNCSVISGAEMYLTAAGQFQHLSPMFNSWTGRQALPVEYQLNDLGSSPREDLRAASKLGLCSEDLCPYNLEDWTNRPSDAAFADAAKRKVDAYFRIQHEMLSPTDYGCGQRMIYQIRHARASGFAVGISMTIGENMFTIGDGIYQPTGSNNPALGIHMMNVQDFHGSGDDGYVTVEGSWGDKAGVKGRMKVSYLAIRTDRVDVWATCGFAGIAHCGPDLVQRVTRRFDINGIAGQVYRLYQAAFGRIPDIGGLTNWVKAMDAGMTLAAVAQGFAASDEFALKYGSSQSTVAFVTMLYANVLHRAPDAGGLQNWINQIDGHAMTRTQVLMGFSESPENKNNTALAVKDGIAIL